jgi:transcriptional regulator with XRE-family HTH domain
MEPLHKRLKRLREARQISTAEMARQIRVPMTTYREWEYGRSIKGEPYLAIAKVLEVGVYELLCGEKVSSKRELLETLDGAVDSLQRLRADLLSHL